MLGEALETIAAERDHNQPSSLLQEAASVKLQKSATFVLPIIWRKPAPWGTLIPYDISRVNI